MPVSWLPPCQHTGTRVSLSHPPQRDTARSRAPVAPHGGTPTARPRFPPFPLPVAPAAPAPRGRCAGSLLVTHARAGSGEPCVAPTHARGVVQPGGTAKPQPGAGEVGGWVGGWHPASPGCCCSCTPNMSRIPPSPKWVPPRVPPRTKGGTLVAKLSGCLGT